jgi:hypothetical protein
MPETSKTESIAGNNSFISDSSNSNGGKQLQGTTASRDARNARGRKQQQGMTTSRDTTKRIAGIASNCREQQKEGMQGKAGRQ